MAKTFFRVDRRSFAIGDEVSPEGTYQSRFNDTGQRTEEILENTRASAFGTKPIRVNSVFVFDDLKCAEQYWRTHDKSYLYEAEIDETSVGHVGDMNWVDGIGGELRKTPMAEPDMHKVREQAKKYWQQAETDQPCKEYLVPRAKVLKQLRGLSDLKSYIRQHVAKHDWTSDGSIEDLTGVGKALESDE
jgi:hypothetical protein